MATWAWQGGERVLIFKAYLLAHNGSNDIECMCRITIEITGYIHMLKLEVFVGVYVNNIDSEMCGKMGSQEILSLPIFPVIGKMLSEVDFGFVCKNFFLTFWYRL